MNSRIKTLKGQTAIELIEAQLSEHSSGIERALAPLEAKHTIQTWLDTLRAIEEFINLPLFGLDDKKLEEQIVKLRLDCLMPNQLKPAVEGLIKKFGSEFANRFLNLVVQASAIRTAFLEHGLFEPAAGLDTVEHAIGYFQSRRGHLVTMLYTISEGCLGDDRINPLNSLNVFLPHVEHSGLTLYGLHKKRVLSMVYPDFELKVEERGFFANHSFDTLDAFFLEPERAGIIEMKMSRDLDKRLEPVDSRLMFSAAEVRNDIILLEDAYSEFGLAESRFGAMADFARACLDLCKDNYFIPLSLTEFNNFASRAGLLKNEKERLIHEGGSYTQNLNSQAPLIRFGDHLISTVTLLSRFLYHWKNSCLDRMKRYQIRSGFIFEETVKHALTKQGFHITDIKRINRKEFDVVALNDKVIYNVQCKNNLVDLGKIQIDPNLFARYNRRLNRTYEAALLKEESRENLLKEKLGLSDIKHFVLSRFPVATTNQRVLAYLHIDKFRQLVVN